MLSSVLTFHSIKKSLSNFLHIFPVTWDKRRILLGLRRSFRPYESIHPSRFCCLLTHRQLSGFPLRCATLLNHWFVMKVLTCTKIHDNRLSSILMPATQTYLLPYKNKRNFLICQVERETNPVFR